jgi:CubicO group peptidase (beta-lactamase class C family)
MPGHVFTSAPMKFGKIIRGTASVLALLLLVLIVALWLKPPELLRIGANYAAKIVCSNVFLAGRDPDEVLRTDVQAPGAALLHLMRVSVDRQQQVVRAGLLGFIGDGVALARPDTGCAVVADGNVAYARQIGVLAAAAVTTPAAAAAGITADPNSGTSAATDAVWPDGEMVTLNPALERVLADDALAGPGVRAVVVVDHGRIVAERYGAGFSAATPLLGWSMTKTVIAGVVGALIKDGRLTLDQAAFWPKAAGAGRDRIRIADLLAMSSGLRFNEGYGAVSDVTRMLYLQPDMPGFAHAQPLEHTPGEYWSYSSGSANILSRIVQDAAGPVGANYPREKLFKPLGMTSATMETDEDGSLVGSSYMYATARDWARYGLFLMQAGDWHGQEILPAGYVAMMTSPVAASGGQYGHGLVWVWGSDGKVPGQNPDSEFGIPADTFWMMGHDGQSTAIIASRGLVVVRLGLTPWQDRYQPQPLVKALLAALP